MNTDEILDQVLTKLNSDKKSIWLPGLIRDTAGPLTDSELDFLSNCLLRKELVETVPGKTRYLARISWEGAEFIESGGFTFHRQWNNKKLRDEQEKMELEIDSLKKSRKRYKITTFIAAVALGLSLLQIILTVW